MADATLTTRMNTSKTNRKDLIVKKSNRKAKAINPRKLELIELSKIAKELVNAGEYESVNEALIAMYEDELGKSELMWNTFGGWKKKGFKVNKDETGFPIWGKPRKLGVTKDGEFVDVDEAKEDPDVKKMKYWPMAYLFNVSQVSAR